MLRLTLHLGDDFYVGREGHDLEDYKQIILNASSDGSITLLTPDEVIEAPLSEKVFTDLDIEGVRVSITRNDSVPDSFRLTLDMEEEVSVLRGRLYRRTINE